MRELLENDILGRSIVNIWEVESSPTDGWVAVRTLIQLENDIVFDLGATPAIGDMPIYALAAHEIHRFCVPRYRASPDLFSCISERVRCVICSELWPSAALLLGSNKIIFYDAYLAAHVVRAVVARIEDFREEVVQGEIIDFWKREPFTA